MVATKDFGFDDVNVAKQDRDSESLLQWMQHMLHIRKKCPEFGWGKYRVLPGCHASVLAHRCEWNQGTVVAVHNLSKRHVSTAIEVAPGEQLIEVAGDRMCQPVEDTQNIKLPPYAYRWFRIQGNGWLAQWEIDCPWSYLVGWGMARATWSTHRSGVPCDRQTSPRITHYPGQTAGLGAVLN